MPNPKPLTHTVNGKHFGSLPDPQNFGVISDGIPYPAYPSIGSQKTANGGIAGPASIGASLGPQITPATREAAISEPIAGPGHLPKHGRG